MPLTKLDVKAIKDGTDGQIITWDASAKANAVGPGVGWPCFTAFAEVRLPAGETAHRRQAAKNGR